MTGSPATTGSGTTGIPVPDRRRGYAPTAAVLVVMMLGGTLPIPLYVIYEPQMGFGILGVTVVFAAYVAGTLFALVALGDLSDHIRAPESAGGRAACATVSTVLFLVSDGIGLLAAAGVVSGLAAGFITGTATAGLAELQPRGDRRAAAVVASGANQTGLGLGPLIAGVFAEYVALPTRSVFWAYLGLCALALAALAVIPETVRNPDQVSGCLRKTCRWEEVRPGSSAGRSTPSSAWTSAAGFPGDPRATISEPPCNSQGSMSSTFCAGQDLLRWQRTRRGRCPIRSSLTTSCCSWSLMASPGTYSSARWGSP
jgi:MFS family permease